jgi:drug/metabolite transporter (DMT)-like permease
VTGATVAGLGVAAAASASFEVSYALQALEARAVGGPPGPSAGLLRDLARRPLFLGAIALALGGFGLQVAALGLAPLTLVQPVLALGLVLLLFLGSRVLGERVGPAELAGVGAVIAGVTLIALSAPQREVTPSGTTGHLAAVAGLGLAVAIPALLARRGHAGGVALAVAAGAADALAGLAAKLISDALSSGRPVAALGWAAAAGVAVLVGLSCELAALQLLPVARVGPLVLAIQIAVPVALAPLVAGEEWGSTPLGGVVIVAGLAVVTAGAVLLGSSAPVRDLRAGEPQHQVGGQRQ